MTKTDIKNLPIGEIFEYKGKKYKVVEETNEICCPDCDFFAKHCNQLCENGFIPECGDMTREDKTSVVFIELIGGK